MRLAFIAALFFVPMAVIAQNPPANPPTTTVDPTNRACTANSVLNYIPSGQLFTCQNGTYQRSGGGSGGGGTTGTVYCNATGGAGNVLACTPSPAISSYSNLITGFAVDAANSNATTLNISGLGAKNLYYQGSALTSVALTGYCVGGGCAVYYDGTQLELILNPVAGNGSISTAGNGSGLVTLSGGTSGSWGLQALAVQGTPSSWNPPAADPGGANYLPLFGAPSGGQIPISYVASSGTGSVLRATAVPSAQGCGTTSACSHTAITGAQIVYGSVPLVTGTPSTATITGISPAFTSSSTFVCTLGAQSSATGALLSVANVSGSSFTITGPAAVTTVINYICVGT